MEVDITGDKTEKEQQETKVYTAALPLSSAVRTGLEPATLGVTGRYSNHLNYRTRLCAPRTPFDLSLRMPRFVPRLRVQSYIDLIESTNFSE